MNRNQLSAPHVAVIGSGLGPYRDLPGFHVDMIDDDIAALPRCDYDLLHTSNATPRGTATLEHRRGRSYLSPSQAGDAALISLGIKRELIHRWRPGVDPTRFTPAAYDPCAIPAAGGPAVDQVNLLHVGPLGFSAQTLLLDAFALALRHDPRLRLLTVGAPPSIAGRPAVTELGELDPDGLAAVYASADLLVFADGDDEFAQVVLEAQASGLPVLAVDGGGAAELIESGRSGCLVQGSAPAVAEAIFGLARRAKLRERLVTGGLISAREWTWERSLDGLAAAWTQALAPAGRELARAA